MISEEALYETFVSVLGRIYPDLSFETEREPKPLVRIPSRKPEKVFLYISFDGGEISIFTPWWHTHCDGWAVVDDISSFPDDEHVRIIVTDALNWIVLILSGQLQFKVKYDGRQVLSCEVLNTDRSSSVATLSDNKAVNWLRRLFGPSRRTVIEKWPGPYHQRQA